MLSDLIMGTASMIADAFSQPVNAPDRPGADGTIGPYTDEEFVWRMHDKSLHPSAQISPDEFVGIGEALRVVNYDLEIQYTIQAGIPGPEVKSSTPDWQGEADFADFASGKGRYGG